MFSKIRKSACPGLGLHQEFSGDSPTPTQPTEAGAPAHVFQKWPLDRGIPAHIVATRLRQESFYEALKVSLPRQCESLLP